MNRFEVRQRASFLVEIISVDRSQCAALFREGLRIAGFEMEFTAVHDSRLDDFGIQAQLFDLDGVARLRAFQSESAVFNAFSNPAPLSRFSDDEAGADGSLAGRLKFAGLGDDDNEKTADRQRQAKMSHALISITDTTAKNSD